MIKKKLFLTYTNIVKIKAKVSNFILKDFKILKDFFLNIHY